MELKVEGNDKLLRIRIVGDVTADGCTELREAVMDLLASRPAQLEFDLAQMPFIDTSGLGVLIGLRSTMKKQGTAMTVANPQPRVLQVFRLTQLSKMFGLE